MLRTMLVLCVLGAIQAPAAGPDEPFAAAVAHYRAGRHAEALAGFTALAAADAAALTPELLGNLALSALRRQRTAEAEAAARQLAAHALPAERALGEFLLGQAAGQRCARAEAAAKLPDAEPAAFDLAVRAAEQALAAFVRADALRGGWPAALRNAERAALRVRDLQQQREAAARNRPRPQQEPDRPPPPAPEPGPEAVDPALATNPLSSADVARLLERLQQQERAKRALRLAGQRATLQAGERDW